MSTKTIEQAQFYVIVNKQTKELWSDGVYSSSAGAKNSYRHATKRANWIRGEKSSIKFNDQDIYKIVKVKLAPVDE